MCLPDRNELGLRVRRFLRGTPPALGFLLIVVLCLAAVEFGYTHGTHHNSSDDDDDDGGSPTLDCRSDDGTNSPSCFKNRTDAQLEFLINGSDTQPFDSPVVCGMEISTPDDARWVLRGSGSTSSPCNKLQRDVLTTILSIRKSILLGDGLIGEDPAGCSYNCAGGGNHNGDDDDGSGGGDGLAGDGGGRTWGWTGNDDDDDDGDGNDDDDDGGSGSSCTFRIVLRCGDVFIPDESTADPDDAVVVTESTSLQELADLASQLCELSQCPNSTSKPCGSTLNDLAGIFNQINETDEGECKFDPPPDPCDHDDEPPTLTCPTGILTFECQGPDGAPIDYEVSAVDNCDPNPTINCYPPSGTILPVGVMRRVDCHAKDDDYNKSTCWFNVLVVDTTPPEISCPDDVTVDCVTGQQNGATVDYPDPMASDLCDGYVDVVCDPPSGSFFDFGCTTVTCVATDNSDNTKECTFEVCVVEQTPPELSCPGDLIVECTSPNGAIVEYPPPTLSSTCNPPLAPVCNPLSGSQFPMGVTTVTCMTTLDDGIVISCDFDVTVRDSQNPTVVCPNDMVVECSFTGGSSVSFNVTATDLCDETVDIVCTPPSSAVFPIGTTTVTCVGTDDAGNTDSCEFDITVRDMTPPEIVCPQGPIQVSCDLPDGGGAVVNYPQPMITEVCDEAVEVVCVPASGSVFPLGTTTVTCTATDDAGNTESCDFEVIVDDSSPPEIVCPGDIFAECESIDGAVVDYPAPVISNECNGAPTYECIPASGSRFPIGMTVVTCTATDQSGNSSTCTFKVQVDDTTPPEIMCPANIGVECESPSGTPVNYTASAHDTCDLSPDVTCDPPSGTVFPIGLSTVTCTAIDEAGNRSECEFTVSVVDTTPPDITCPDAISVECTGPDGTAVTFSAGAVDLCDLELEISCIPPSGSVFSIGTTTVSCTATDDAGNSNSCDFEVEVKDTTPPVIVCPDDMFKVRCRDPNGAPLQYPIPTANDVCDTAPEVVCDPPIDTVLPRGTHKITCTATDDAGNEAMCMFDVEIVDDLPPGLECPMDVEVECTSPDGATVEYPLPVPIDECDPNPSIVCEPVSGSTFALGMTMVICTATDASGNSVQCSFMVKVVDTTPPSIECPSNVSKMCETPDGAPCNFEAGAVDVCDSSPSVVCDPPTGTVFPIGNTMVTCTATDSAGNSNECTFMVTIVDDTPPEITCPQDFEVECTDSESAIVEYPGATAFDTCDRDVEVVCDPASGSRMPLGANIITCTATDDAGNTAMCMFTVTVVDTTPPELICSPDMMIHCVDSQGAPVSYDLPVSNDACDGQPPVTCSPPPGSNFALGQTEVVCTSSDQSGNETQCTFFVTVVDTVPPNIEGPKGVITVESECGNCVELGGGPGSLVEFDVTATDNCDSNPHIECNPPSGTCFPVGQTMVICTAHDESGNETTASFMVNVADSTVPEIACPGDITLECSTKGLEPQRPHDWPPGFVRDPIACQAKLMYDVPPGSDICDTDTITVTCIPPPGTLLGLGTHTVTCRARDSAGNEATCSFTVEVVEAAETAFIRGDANEDSNVNIGDVIFQLYWLFYQNLLNKMPGCDDALDSNDDGLPDLSDVIFTLRYLFFGEDTPSAPFYPFCGCDPTNDDPYGCDRFKPCQ